MIFLSMLSRATGRAAQAKQVTKVQGNEILTCANTFVRHRCAVITSAERHLNHS